VGAQPRGWPAGPEKPAGEPHWIAERTFRRGDAPEVRRFAQAFGSRAGLGGGQLPDFVLAVNEAAACAIARRPGTARVRLRVSGARVYCEVQSDAPVTRDHRTEGLQQSGRRGEEEEELRRQVLRQVCDYFWIAFRPEGTWVMLTMAVRRAARDPSGRGGMPQPR
jgi:hypothetical protein